MERFPSGRREGLRLEDLVVVDVGQQAGLRTLSEWDWGLGCGGLRHEAMTTRKG